MKKILVSVLAIAGLVACNNENVISVADSRTPITFDGVFVENATRADDPSTTTDNINEFYVWAYMNEVDGIVFDDETVTRSGDKWTYGEPSYWMPDNHYYFAAFAGDRTYVEGLPTEMEANGLGEITFTNNDGTNDILYAEYDVLAATTNNPVKFQFAHLLSKVKFTFINGFANENQTIVVKNIQMVAPEVATIDLSADELAWANYSEDVTLDFGDMNGAAKLAIGDKKSSDNERLTIPAPATQSYTITFVVDVYNGNQPGIENRLMTVELNGFEFVAGRAYNLVATINQENLDLDAIEFEVVVDEWIEQEVDGGAVEGEVTFVTTAAEIQAILDAATTDVTILFGNDIEGDLTNTQKPNVNVVLDGAGHNYKGVITVDGKSSTILSAGLTIKNINFDADAISADACVRLGDGTNATRYTCNVTVDNCTFDVPGAVGIKSYTGGDKNLVISECTATANAHSLVQAKGIDGILVKGCTVLSKNGMNFNNSTNVFVDGCTTDVKGYAARFGESSGGTGAAESYVIKNSTLKSACEDGDSVIIIRGSADNSTLTIQNTTIEGERSIANTATGAKVIVDGNEVTTIASSAAELKDVVANASAGATVAVAEGTYGKFPSVNKEITLICNDVVFEGNSKLNIGGSTVIGATFSNPSGNAVDQTINGIFKNCTFTGSNALRYSYVGETCVFENCVFDGSVYGIHFDGGTNKEVTFRNCTISGFNGLAAAIGMVTFEGCTFVGNGKSGYNGANLWGSAKMIDCEFTFNGTTTNEWIDCIGADKTYEFVNCTINGVAYTADNYTEYDEIFSRNHTTVKINGVDCAM